jgi:hypothetical protein
MGARRAAERSAQLIIRAVKDRRHSSPTTTADAQRQVCVALAVVSGSGLRLIRPSKYQSRFSTAAAKKATIPARTKIVDATPTQPLASNTTPPIQPKTLDPA